MIWDDEGYLLSKVNYRENSVIVDVFTLNHGKCSGIIYGGSSRKVKKYLQIGNKIFVNYQSKSENRVGYFKVEIIKNVSPLYFNDSKKISSILSACTLLKSILAEGQANKKIFNSFEDLLSSLKDDKWIFYYIYWEQLLVKELGYDINIKQKDKLDVKINGNSVKIPKFFTYNKNVNITKSEISEALQFNKNLIVHNFLDGKFYKIPQSRSILEKYYN